MMLSLIKCTTYQNFMRFYKMVRLLALVKNLGMEPVGMILPLTKFSEKKVHGKIYPKLEIYRWV